MNLRVYLATKHLTQREFAQKCDVDPRYMSRIVNGWKIPGKKLARDIERETQGEIKFELPPKNPRGIQAG
jgi:transcriptional regulator with XRE-family HTH domain